VESIPVPARFYDDHADRALLTPREIRRAGTRVWVSTESPDAIAELLNDAEFYASPSGPDELPPGLKASARRCVDAIRKGRRPTFAAEKKWST